MRTAALFREQSGRGRLVDRQTASNAEVKNEWNHISTPSIRLHGVDWDSFTFVSFAQNEYYVIPLMLYQWKA